MANVLFKRGLQSSLDTLRSNKTATDGTFYMTSDSHRLYVGVANGDAIPVNEGITFVTTFNDLPDVSTPEKKRQVTGQFYYVSGPIPPDTNPLNILCVYNGNTWVQINPNTDTYIDTMDFIVTTDNGVATITHKIKVISKDTSRDGEEYTTSITMEGKDGIVVDNNGDAITITGDTYELGLGFNDNTKEAKVTLTSANTDNDTEVKIKSTDTNLTLAKNGDTLELTAKDTTLDSVSGGYGADAVDEADASSKKEGFYITVADTEGNEGTAHINPQVQIGVEQAFQTTHKLENGIVTLPVYSQREIDRKFRGLDAMRYKGTLGENCAVQSLASIKSECELGDTYLIGADDGYEVTINGVQYKGKKGDMFICNGTENPNSGKIDPTTLTIDIVPSGDDAQQDTTYTVVPTATGFSIQADGAAEDAGTVNFTGDSYINVNVTTGANAKTAEIGLSHKLITASGNDTSGFKYNADDDLTNQSEGNALQIKVVDTITRDAAGHVKEVKVKQYNLKDTNGHMKSNEYSAVNDTGKTLATVTNTVTFETTGGTTTDASAAFGIKSNSMEVTAAGSTVTVDMVWGSFDPS